MAQSCSSWIAFDDAMLHKEHFLQTTTISKPNLWYNWNDKQTPIPTCMQGKARQISLAPIEKSRRGTRNRHYREFGSHIITWHDLFFFLAASTQSNELFLDLCLVVLPLAFRAARSCKNARNGAMPVPSIEQPSIDL